MIGTRSKDFSIPFNIAFTAQEHLDRLISNEFVINFLQNIGGVCEIGKELIVI